MYDKFVKFSHMFYLGIETNLFLTFPPKFFLTLCMVRSDFCNTVHRFVCCIHIYGSEITTSSNCQALFIFGNPLLYNCTIYTDDRYMYFKCSKIPPVSNCVDKEISWNKQRGWMLHLQQVIFLKMLKLCVCCILV